jgi:hypothetical protein
MTTDTRRLKDAYRRSGLALLGYTFERALGVPVIRIALECAIRAQDKQCRPPAQARLI